MPPVAPTNLSWHVLTGEYPPQPGGVGDYSAQVAAGLALRGAGVHVWTNAEDASGKWVDPAGVTTHRLGAGWSGHGLVRLGAALDAYPGPRRLLVQYAPNVWGRRGLNLGFCRWLKSRRGRGDDVRPMFHELWYEFDRRDRPTRWVFPAVQRLMVREVMAASTMAYATIPTWVEWLRPTWMGGGKRVRWLPVPSNVPRVEAPGEVAEVRRRVAPDGRPIAGSFGTYHGPIAGVLAGALRGLKSRPALLLLGRGGEVFAEGLSGLPGVTAPGAMSAREASIHIQACDLMIQPYPDGVTSRRGSVMAALAQGRAVVTTTGWLTEPVWAESEAVALAPAGDAEALAGLAEGLLADPARREALGAAGFALYLERFSLERTLQALLEGGHA